jgi:methionyl-tRNA formyltransferase
VSGQAAAGLRGRDRMTASPSRRIRTIFFGSGSFALPILDALAELPDFELAAIVSAPDRPAGRAGIPTPTPVALRTRQMGLPLLQPQRVRSPASIAALAALAPDLAVLADYGQLIPESLMGLPRLGFLNLHPSALPRHRGASPVPATILAGDTTSAVTLLCLTAELDAGPIVASAILEVRPDDTAPVLERRAAGVAASLLVRTLPDWVAGRIEPVPQAAAGVTMTRPLRREDGLLDPTHPAAELERQVRAFQPWPGSHLETPLGRIVVWSSSVEPGTTADEPGMLVADSRGLVLFAADGRLRLETVQLAGGRRMRALELLRGHPLPALPE